MKFGDRRDCDRMVERIREKIEELKQQKTFADQVKRRTDLLLAEVKYRNDTDSVPSVEVAAADQPHARRASRRARDGAPRERRAAAPQRRRRRLLGPVGRDALSVTAPASPPRSPRRSAPLGAAGSRPTLRRRRAARCSPAAASPSAARRAFSRVSRPSSMRLFSAMRPFEIQRDALLRRDLLDGCDVAQEVAELGVVRGPCLLVRAQVVRSARRAPVSARKRVG